MPGILDGVNVLDLTRNVAGPFCTMLLGDLGATVTKIEKPGKGDDTRDWRPPDWNGWSTTFLGLNRNKRSLAVDIEQEKGQLLLRQLAASADVVVESFRNDASLGKRKLSYEHIHEENPAVIYCSIRAFGSQESGDERPGYDAIIQAATGIMSITGEPERPPVRVGPSIVDQGTGLWSSLAIVSALYRRQQTGEGSLIRSSLYEVGVAWMGYQLVGYLGTGQVPEKLGSRIVMIAPYEAFATKDEHLFLAAPNDEIFVRLCRLLHLDSLLEDDRFSTNSSRVENRDELHHVLERALRREPAMYWEKQLSEAGVPCSRVRTVDQVTHDPHLRSLGMLKPFATDEMSDLRLVDLPFTIDGKRGTNAEPPPKLGEHSNAILSDLGYKPDEIKQLRESRVIA